MGYGFVVPIALLMIRNPDRVQLRTDYPLYKTSDFKGHVYPVVYSAYLQLSIEKPG